MDLWLISYAVLWFLVIAEAIALMVLARAVGAIVLGTRDAIERDGLALGKAAPEFEAIAATGTKVGLGDLSGTYAALIFASPSCRICRSLLPGLPPLARRLEGKARIIVMLRGAPTDAELMAEEAAAPVEVWSIGARGIAEQFHARVSPYLQVIDPMGVVRAKGLVNGVEHVEHLLFEAGLRDQAIAQHSAKPLLATTRG
ncbi:MAG: redoxin domain-containing protein [Chloroflexota bacterium]|nr:redoxin domain-containing protein [Chloroflexota bacterium]